VRDALVVGLVDVVDARKPVQCCVSGICFQNSNPNVEIQTDPSQDEKDKYGRALVYLWLSDGRLFNLEMIRLGFAHEYIYDVPYARQDKFRAAEEDARLYGRALWAPSTCAGDTFQRVPYVTEQAGIPPG
jgi:micrococcal nuclease